VSVQKTEWEQVYKGGHRRAKQTAKEYRYRGYFVRVRNHVTYATVEIADASPYKRFKEMKKNASIF
jgi:hypothetical protein